MSWRRKLALACSAGVAVATLAVLVVLWAGVPILILQLGAGDVLFVRDDGPRLGGAAPAPRQDVLLVEFDRRSRDRLGDRTDPETDLALYRALLADGATFVGDTRRLGDSSNPPTLLESMLATGAGRRLVRNVPARDSLDEGRDRWSPHLAPVGLTFRAIEDQSRYERVYPLLVTDGRGRLSETMPLTAARVAQGDLVTPRAQETAGASGILDHWEKVRRGFGGNPPAPLRYRIGHLELPWIGMPPPDRSVAPAAFWMDTSTSPASLPRVSAAAVLESGARGLARGRVVFLGATPDWSETDVHFLPHSSWRRASTAEVVALAYLTLADGRFMRLMPGGWGLLLLVALCLACAVAPAFLRPAAAAFAIAAALAAFLGAATLAFRNGLFPDLVVTPIAALAAGLLVGGARFMRVERSRRRIEDLFGRYVPRTVVDDLVRSPDAQALEVGGRRCELTVLFADVRGFTSWSDKLPPEEVVGALNGLLRIMVDCAFRHEGTVDKFIGDAVLVLFNAPRRQPDHALRAVRAAWDMQRALEGHPSGLAFGIGVHTGEAVVGTIGTPERMEYTAIGAAVNLASRLCSTAKRGQIVVSDAVQPAVASEFGLEPLPPVRVKGIDRELTTWLVAGGPGDRGPVEGA